MYIYFNSKSFCRWCSGKGRPTFRGPNHGGKQNRRFLLETSLYTKFYLQVNGVNVIESTHTDVVALIKCKLFLFHFFLWLVCFISVSYFCSYFFRKLKLKAHPWTEVNKRTKTIVHECEFRYRQMFVKLLQISASVLFFAKRVIVWFSSMNFVFFPLVTCELYVQPDDRLLLWNL